MLESLRPSFSNWAVHTGGTMRLYTGVTHRCACSDEIKLTLDNTLENLGSCSSPSIQWRNLGENVFFLLSGVQCPKLFFSSICLFLSSFLVKKLIVCIFSLLVPLYILFP